MSDTAQVKTLQIWQSQVPLGSLEAYIQQVNSFPMLSVEEEQLLSRKLREEGDLEAAQKLITSHLRYVVRVAKGYMGYGLMLSDLIQEGTIGLMKAVKRFEPDKKVRLVSFAVHWIRAEIHEFILRNWRIVKVATTKAQRKLFFRLRGAKKSTGWLTQEDIQTVARDLGVKPEEVIRMEQRLHAYDTSFDLPVGVEDNSQYALPAPAEYLESEALDPAVFFEQEGWSVYVQERLREAMQALDTRSQEILQKRWLAEGKKVTLQQLALEYEVSTERIRQLEKKAIEKLRAAMVEGSSED